MRARIRRAAEVTGPEGGSRLSCWTKHNRKVVRGHLDDLSQFEAGVPSQIHHGLKVPDAPLLFEARSCARWLRCSGRMAPVSPLRLIREQHARFADADGTGSGRIS